MAFRRDSDHCYRVPDWDRFPWLEHGFGTKYSASPDPARCSTLKQVHSADSLVAAEPGCLGAGDALLCQISGLCVSVRTADCVPVLFVDPVNRAVAAVHAGWRGTVAGIAPKVVARMEHEFATKAADLEIAIGPAIGQCCYEVGSEVACRFQALFPDREDLSGQARIDLPTANQRQLIAFGVRPAAILNANLCTSCRGDDFHSYRRDGPSAGRLISRIGIL